MPSGAGDTLQRIASAENYHPYFFVRWLTWCSYLFIQNISFTIAESRIQIPRSIYGIMNMIVLGPNLYI